MRDYQYPATVAAPTIPALWRRLLAVETKSDGRLRRGRDGPPLQIRLSMIERTRFQAAADAVGVPLSEYVRRATDAYITAAERKQENDDAE